MLWIRAIRYLLVGENWKQVLRTSSLIFDGLVLYALAVGVGFLMIVGIAPSSVATALPALLTPVLGLILAAGYYWECLEAFQYQSGRAPELPPLYLIHWPRYILQGFQLLGIYAVWLAILAALFYLNKFLGVFLTLFSLSLSPISFLMAAFSARRRQKNLFGYFGALRISLRWLNRHAGFLYVQTLLYTLVVGMVFVPAGIILLSITGFGLLLVPGVIMNGLIGYGYVLCTLVNGGMVQRTVADTGTYRVQRARVQQQPERKLTNPFNTYPQTNRHMRSYPP